MAEEELVSGVRVSGKAFREKKTLVCEPCILGKQTRESFPKESVSKESTEPLQLVHMDVCGPMPKASKGGNKYLATFLDDYSKLSVVQPLKKKSNIATVTEGVLARLELQTGKKVKVVQTDRGGEYVNEEMTTLLRKRGIMHRKTVGYSPEQNGSIERLNRDLQEKGRAMLEDSGLGEELWAEAMVTANYTRNRLPSRVHGKTPWEKFFGEKPNVSHMRVFGAHAYMHIPKENRKKMQSVSERGVFVGYEPNYKAYRVLRERDERILVSRDVIVNKKPAFETIELIFGSKKEEEGARDLSHVSPPTQMGARDIPTGTSGTYSDGCRRYPYGEVWHWERGK
jgi:transposase InsO family protein